MTYEEIASMIASIADALGCDYNYYTDEEREVLKTPYLLFEYQGRDDLFADDKNYVHLQTVRIEYDSRRKELDSESVIERILEDNDLTYTKQAEEINGQSAYEVMYTMEVLINEQ